MEVDASVDQDLKLKDVEFSRDRSYGLRRYGAYHLFGMNPAEFCTSIS